MTKLNQATRLNSRRNWLRSGSMIAAAAALAAGASAPAFAQARPGLSGTGMEITMQDRVQARSGARTGTGRNLPSEIPSIRPQPQPAPTRAVPILTNSQTNTVAAPNASPVVVGAAPTVPSIPVNPSAPVVQTQTQPQTASTVTPFAVIPEPGIAGINVSAFARFDDTQVAFNPGVAVDQVNVLGSSAIIDWTTFDVGVSGGEVTFLGDSRNLTFTSNQSDYTVLNRIMTPGSDAAIRIDGNVTSTILDSSIIGGNVWFYSAGGIVVGADASFNIGSLLLSTSLIDESSVMSGGADINFTGSPADSFIRIENGATINAFSNNSYVAMVAPRIEQLGLVNVNGSTAYVAAEEAELTISNNLFDITVNVGSEDDNGIVHTGTTTGPASLSIQDEHGIYFVAVPKNAAITMLVGGEVGYVAASNATTSNGQIILTTGNRVERAERNVFIRNSDGSSSLVEVSSNTVDTTVDGGAAGSIVLEDVTFRSDVVGFAEESLTIQAGATSAGDAVVARDSAGRAVDLDFTAGQQIDLAVTNQGRIDVGGSLSLTSGDGNGTGGGIALSIDQTAISASAFDALSVGGSLTLDASARGLDDIGNTRNNGGNGIGEDAVAGDVSINVVNDASVNITGGLNINASANGGLGEFVSGSATAGSVDVSMSGTSFSVGGTFDIDANALAAGTLVTNQAAARGSNSTGGDVTINIAGGTVDWGGLDVEMGARASEGDDLAIVQSNDATVGDFVLNVTDGFHVIGSLAAFGFADAGNAIDGIVDNTGELAGVANRGSATLSVSNFDTGLEIAGSATLAFDSRGDVGVAVENSINISVTDTGFGTGSGLLVDGSLTAFASHTQGNAGSVQEGGTISVVADNGLFSANSLFLTSNSRTDEFAASSNSATEYVGGDISFIARNSAIVNVTGSSTFSSDGTGLVGLNGASVGRGQGGTVTLLADDASMSFGGILRLGADGFAFSGTNDDGDAASGIGGTVRITVQGAGGSLNFADLIAGTDGTFAGGGEIFNSFFEGNGSPGIGGRTEVNVLGGTLTAQDIVISSSGLAGPGGDLPTGEINPVNGLASAGAGGQGTGGEVTFNINGGDATVTNLTVAANGRGGDGGSGRIGDDTNAGSGGDATGGNATLNAISGSLTVTNILSVEATGNDATFGGGEGGFARGTIGGDGGAATGGTAVFNLDGTAIIDAAIVEVTTAAFGGDGEVSRNNGADPDQGGGNGGDAFGGNAVFNDVAGILRFGTLTVDASGTGGDGAESDGGSTGSSVGNGGAGGNGTGGSALITLNQDNTDPRTFSVISRGLGGTGGRGNQGGAGGSGFGGSAELSINNVDVIFNTVTIDAAAIGGNAGFNDGITINDGADGGDSEAGDARLLVSGADGNFLVQGLVSIVAASQAGSAGAGTTSINDVDPGGNGGLGGSAIGGSATVEVADGAAITLDSDFITFGADSFGGNGGAGGGNTAFAQGGDGGQGGSGTGGTVGVTATNGATLDVISSSIPFTLSSTGTGGVGGDAGQGGTNGIGGNGGVGTGGSPLIRATGATINIGEVELIALGQGASAGSDEPFGSVVVANSEAGAGIGGTPIIEVIEGSPGIINLGDVTITATGAAGPNGQNGLGSGGQVLIRDASTSPTGLITFGDLLIDADGDTGTATGLITITSNSGPITVNGNLVAGSRGDINVTMIGDGQLLVGGDAAFGASETIGVRHGNQPVGLSSIDVAGSFLGSVITGAFIASDNGDINANGPVTITAESISYDNITSPGTVTLTATNGSITGASTGTIIASAVNDAIILTASDDVTFGILNNVDGDPNTRDGNIDVDAGGDITGVAAISGQTIGLNAGGLISVGTVDTLETSVGTVTINGGAIDLGTLNARFISNITSTAGDIAIDIITGNTNIGLDSAAAIILGTAATGDFGADAVTDVTIGSLTTTGVADIGINAGGIATYTNIDSDRLVTINATEIVGGDLLADAGINLNAERIDIGDVTSTGGFVGLTSNSDGITAGDLTSATLGVDVDSAAEAVLGNVTADSSIGVSTLTDLTIASADAGASLSFSVGGNLDAGALSAATTSPGLTLNVSGDADVESAATNGLLTLNIAGALTGGDFTGVSLTRLNAASVDIDSVESVDQSVTVTAATGDAIVGFAGSRLNTTITGENVTLNGGDVGRVLTLDATNGSITSTGTVTVGTDVDLDATQAINIGDLNINDGSILIDAGTDFTSGNVSIASGGNASSERIVINAGGNIDSGSIAAIDGLTMNAGGSLTADSLTGTLVAATAGGAVDVGDVSIFAGVSGGGSINISGTSIAIDSATANTVTGNQINLTAASGIVDVGTADANGNVTIDASGDVTFGTLTGLGVFIDSGANVTGTSASSDRAINSGTPRDVQITAVGAVDVTNFVTVNDVEITASSFTTDSIITGLNTGGVASDVFVNVTGNASIAAADVQGTMDIDAATITLGDVIMLGTLDLLSTVGSIDINSIITSQNVVVSSADAITLGSSEQRGTDTFGNESMSFTAGGDVVVTGIIRSDDAINLTAGGLIDTQALEALDAINVNAGTSVNILSVDVTQGTSTATIGGQSITVGTANSVGGFVANATAGDLQLTDVTAGGLIDLDASGNIDFDALVTGGQVQANAGGNITGVSSEETGADTFGNESMSFTAGGDVIVTGIIRSDDAINITAGGLANVANFVTPNTGNVNVTGGSVIVNDGSVDGSFTATSTIGDITFDGTVEPVRSLTANSAANINIGTLGISDGNLTLNAVGDVIGENILNTAPDGDFQLDRIIIDAGGNIIVTGLIETLDDGVFLTAGGDVSINQLSGASTNSVIAGGAISIGTLTSAKTFDATLTGTSVNIDSGSISADLIVTSTTGDITGSGAITVAGIADLDSAQNIAIGTLEANNIDLTAAGDLRFNGLTSPNAITLSATSGTIGATTPGLGDIDSGGAVNLTAEAIDLGNVDSDTLITAVASVGNASFGDLTAGTTISIAAAMNPIVQSVTSGGNVDLTGASISLGGGDVGGNLTLDAQAGDITLAFDGTDQLLVAGSTVFTATGDMNVTHTNNGAGTISVDIGGSTRVDIGGSFTSEAGTIIDSTGELLLLADGNITADDLRTEPGMLLQAGGNVLVNNATATGPQGVSNFRGITIEAGLQDFASVSLFDNFANATITGVVTSYADIDITAGGNAVFAAGSTTAADNGLTVNTGDDIIVEAGAMLSSANNPTDVINAVSPFDTGPNLILNAGGETNLVSVPATPIASLVMDGTLDANEAAIILTGNAIEGLDSTLIAGSIRADIVNAPVSAATLSTDNGLLSGVCVEGIVCLGDMQATNRIEIGQNSNNDVIQLFIEQAVISATDILITTRNDIVMGTNGIDTTLDASGTFSATSITGNVELNDAAITATQILLDAANSVIGTGILTSANDIGIDVGSSISVGGIITGGELTTVGEVGGAIEGFYSVPNDFTAGIYSQGSTSIDLNAGGNIDIGEAVSPDSIFLSADGDAFLGLASVPGDIQIDAGNVGYDDLDAGGSIFLGANTGSITAGLFSSAVAGLDIDYFAAGDVDVGDLTAGNLVNVDGNSIALGVVTGADITLISGSDILFNLLDSGSAIILDANAGTIATNTDGGNIISAGAVALDAQEIAIGDITADGTVDAAATAGTASFGDVTTNTVGSGISLSAAGAASDVQAGTLTTNSGDILVSAEQNIALTAAATSAGTPTAGSIGLLAGGDLNVTGDLSAGEDASIRALGGATLGNVTAGDDVIVDADGAIGVGNATANGSGIDLFSLVFDEASAGQRNSILFGAETSTGSNIALDSGSDVTATGTLTADNAINVTAAGTPIVANAISGGDTSITGTSVTFDNGTVGGDLTLNATAGDIDGNGAVSVGGAIDFDATGNVGFGALSAGGGSFTVDAGGDIAFTSATSTDFITMNALGAVNGGDVTATNAVSVNADNIALGDVIAGQINLISASDILFNLLQSPNAISLSAANGLIGMNTGSGDIDTDDDVDLLAEFINVGQIDAGGDVTATATGTPDAGGMGGSGPVVIGGGAGLEVALSSANITSGGAVDLTAVNGPVSTGDVDAASNLSIEGAGVTTGDLIARAVFDAGVMLLTSSGDLSIGTASSVGRFTANADGDVDFVSITNTRNTASIVAGGSISGGAVTVTQQSTGGTSGSNLISLSAGGDITLSEDTSAQSGISLIADGAITAQNITSTTPSGNNTVRGGGAVSVGDVSGGAFNSTLVLGTSVSTGSVTGGGVFLEATDGSVTATGTVTGAEATRLRATQDVTAGDVQGGNTLTLAGGGDVTFGDIAALIGDLTVTAGGDITGNSATRSSSIVGGIGLRLDADGDVDVGTITSATSATVAGTAIIFGTADTQTSFNAAGDTIDFDSVSAGTDATLAAGNGNLTGSVEAGETATITASNGVIEMANLTAMDADLLASGAIEVGDADVIGLLDAEGTSIDITSGSGSSLVVDVTATDGAISVVSNGDLNVISASATENVTLASIENNAQVAQVSGDDVTISAVDRLTITEDVDAVGALTLDVAGGLARIEAAAIGETISVAAANVDILADGQLGDATRTTSIEFETFRELAIGGVGTDNEGGLGAFFEVDNTEFARIHSAGDIQFTAFSNSSAPDGLIRVDTLDVVAGDGSDATGQNIGQTGALILQADGDIEINGDATVTNATIETGFIADALNLVQLDTANGGIFLLDANEGLSGAIEIFATDFVAATDDAFNDIQGLSLADIDIRLADSDGVDRPDGVIRADSLAIETIASQVFIQNTVPGTDFDQRRGFDVNTLFITTNGSTVQPIVINGIVAGVTGIDAIALVDIGSQFAAASTINGCLIANPASCGAVIVDPTPVDPGTGGEIGGGAEIEIRDLIEEVVEEEEDGLIAGVVEGNLITINPDNQFSDDPLIDDPVTGAGNEDLWVSDEEPGE